MSILLDALRKSEKDKQKVEAPSIHSGEESKPVPGLLKNKWWLLLIVVVATGVSFAWYQFGQPEDASETSSALASVTGDADDQQTTVPTGKTETDTRMAAVSNEVPNRPRTPVEAYEQSTDTRTKTKTGAAGKANAAAVGKQTVSTGTKKPAANNRANKKPAANNQANKKPAARNQANKNQPGNKQAAKKQSATGKPTNKKATNQQAAQKPSSKKPADNNTANAKAASTNQANAKPAGTNKKPFRPQVPAPINYWELPDAVRERVPEMKFTVLVYAKDPADRFVLIDGQRYRQGEAVQPELFVREIRRKGVVFKYRLYKFLVER